MSEKIWKIIILSLVAIAFFGLPFSMLAFGSELNTQRNPLYPFQSTMMLQDEFITGLAATGQIGQLGWQSAGTITYNGGATNRPGMYRFDTGAVSGTLSRVNFSGSTSFVAAAPHSILWVNRLNTNDANTTIRIGSANSVAANPPNEGIYFEKLDADTNWFCVTRTGATQTRTDSGIAVSTSFANFLYSLNSSGVTFQINNANVCTHTTNIPTGLIAAFSFIINSAAASKTFDVDYFQMIMTGLTR